MTVNKLLSAVDEIRDKLDEIDDLRMVLSVMGTAFDEYCAERGMSSEETCEALSDLVKVQAEIHTVMGRANYKRGKHIS